MTLRRFVDEQEQEELEALFREAMELEDDEPIDPYELEMFRRRMR